MELRVKNRDFMDRDLNVIWHPCTQMKDHEFLPIIPIKRGKGSYLEDFEGKKYLDAISSWWVNLFGHSNPYINGKIKEQLDDLEHVILAGFTHEQAVKLAERLVEITPQGLEKCFFADNGSSGVEVALKMSFHYFKNRGEKRPYFISLKNSYHGETLGALAVGDVELYKKTYDEIMIKSIQVPVPENKTLDAIHEPLQALENLLKERASEISGIILEPIVQCAGSMHMYHPYYLRGVRSLTKKYGIHFIADEVATGFGRTGKMFAVEHAHVSPDFIILSKGLTGGYLPLSVVLTTNDIYREFYCDYNLQKSFLHSHSYTGNALACAAANATLDIFEKDSIIEDIGLKIEYFAEKLERFQKLPNVKETRQTGMICAIELKDYPPEDRIGLKVYKYALKYGVILRPLGNVIYFMPPLSISYHEIDEIVTIAYRGIESLIPENDFI
jgi:adenosylmethionine-8-amino-7-oxononanoate aminotransferase